MAGQMDLPVLHFQALPMWGPYWCSQTGGFWERFPHTSMAPVSQSQRVKSTASFLSYLSGKACLPRLTFSDPYSNGQQRSWKYLTLRLWSFNSGHITPGITSTWGPRLFVWPLNVWEFDILEMLDSSRQRLLKQNKNSLFLRLSFQSNNIAWFIEQVLITFQLWLHHLKRIKGMQRNSGHDTRPVLMLPNLVLFVFLFYKRGNRGQKQ